MCTEQSIPCPACKERVLVDPYVVILRGEISCQGCGITTLLRAFIYQPLPDIKANLVRLQNAARKQGTSPLPSADAA